LYFFGNQQQAFRIVKHTLTIIIISLWGSFVFGQTDTAVIFAERLLAKDIETDIEKVNNFQVVSASRSLQAVEDLPFTVFVITKEDIRNNGYNTLVDALKMVPGIRVSQPGTGTDGETF
jgi:outer membrane receptor for ferrienterochelin and colicin